jgi:hypothetical protein
MVDLHSVLSSFQPQFTKLLIRLSRAYDLHPECLSISSLEPLGTYAVTSGGFGDVWRGTLGGLPGGSTVQVAVKIVKIYGDSEIKELMRVG